MERMLQEAVAGLSQHEQDALRQMGSTPIHGAINALRLGMDEQLNRMAQSLDQNQRCHIRIVKP